MTPPRRCAWCKGPIPPGKRRDAVTCSQRCRQAAHRFGQGCRARELAAEPKRLAYADPPYPGLSDYYRDHPDYGGEVDHRDLVSRLQQFDGWALSTSAEAVPEILALCAGTGASLAVWVRGARKVRASRPLHAWEAVIYRPARAILRPASDPRVDALVFTPQPRLTDPDRVIGAKPSAFMWWMFDLIAALGGDTLDDLFPGSGGVGRAWDLFQQYSRDASATSRPDASTAGELDG